MISLQVSPASKYTSLLIISASGTLVSMAIRCAILLLSVIFKSETEV